MSASNACSHCLRTLRHTARPNEKTIRLATRISITVRPLTTIPPRWQEASSSPRQDPNSDPHTQPPPIGTPTGTANITAAVPPKTAGVKSGIPKSRLPDLPTSQMQRQITDSLAQPSSGTITANLAQRLRKTARSTTESYITYGLTEAFFKSCAAQAPYTIPEDQRTRILTDKGPPKTADGEDIGIPEIDTWWFRELGLTPTFSTWSQVTYLHMYLLTVRLRALENTTAFTNYQRYLLEHFSHAAEDKMALLHSMQARGIRNRYLKDLFLQWRGLLAAYDEGLVKGDAVLAGALWRNIWKGKDDVDWEKVAVVVAYMRRAISELARVELDELTQNLDGGARVWDHARRDLEVLVARKSKGIGEAVVE